MRFAFKTQLQTMPWADLASFWKRADQIELFDTGWVNDHLYNPSFPEQAETSHSFEAFTAVASLATITRRVRIGTLVANNLFRHPAVLARMAVTVDHISGGRFELGMGAGWHEREHADHGIDLMRPGRRLDAFDEACTIVRDLLRGETVTHAGEHYQLDQARLVPRPVQDHLPLTIGGSGEKRTLRIVAEHADHWNFGSVHDGDNFTHKCEVLQQHCQTIGRDYSAISKSIQVWVPEETDQLVEAVLQAKEWGADQAILYFPPNLWDRLEEYAAALDEVPELEVP